MILMSAILEGFLPNWCSMFMYAVIIIFTIVKFGFNIKKLFINLAFVIIVLSVLQAICAVLIYNILQGKFEEEIIMFFMYITMIIMYAILSIWIKWNKIIPSLSKIYIEVILFLLISCIIIAICLFINKLEFDFRDVEYTVILFSIMAIGIVMISWTKYKTKAIEAEAQLNAYKLYETSYENLLIHIRTRQHEFDNHINAIYSSHILYDDYETLVQQQKEYCEKIVSDNKYSRLLKIGNTIIIGFLYGKFAELEKRGIEVEYEIKTSAILDGIPEYKVVEIIGNLINNAADAVSDMDNKKIYINIHNDEEYAYIEVENPYPYVAPSKLATFFEKGYSEKGEQRGLGLYSLKNMSEKYDFEISCKNHVVDEENRILFLIKKRKKDA